MNKYSLLIKYIKEWGLPLAFKHYFLGSGQKILSQQKTYELQKKMMYKKIDVIKKEFKPYIENLNNRFIGNISNEQENIIWQYWDKKPIPKVVQLCTKSVLKYSQNNKRILLDDFNLLKYYNPSDVIRQKKKDGYITRTHFSDILRVNLLYMYGGAWLDSTILLTKEQGELFKNDFWTIKRKPSDMPLKGMWAGFAMSSRKNNKLMYYLTNLFEIYWQNHDTMIDYFLIDIFIYILYCEDADIKRMMDAVPLNNVYCGDLDKDLNLNINDIPKKYNGTEVFKLSWKNSKLETINGEDTLFRKLLNEYEIN